MFQTHDAYDNASSSHSQSLADSSERLRSSVNNQDVMDYQRRQNNSGTNPSESEKTTSDKTASERTTSDKTASAKTTNPNNPYNPYNPHNTGNPYNHYNNGVKIENNTIHFPVVATPEQFRERVLRIFSEVDKNQNGFLSRPELATAVENHQYVGEDAQVVAGLYNKTAFDGLVRVSIDQGGNETALSRRDVQRMDIRQRSEELQEADLVTPWVSKNFSLLDGDSNGYIDFDEIDAMERKSTNVKEKILYGVLKENFNTIQNASNDEWFSENDGITRADLATYSRGFKHERAYNDVLDSARDEALGTAERTYESQLEGSDVLYANGNPRSAINADAIKQGTAGDCYFLAPLASIAEKDPDIIRRMIKDNKDGTYTVTFKGDPEHPVTVAGPTEAEQGLYNGGSTFGIWASVVERAFGKWRLDHGNTRVENPLTTVEAADGGDTNAFAMRLLTGHSSTTFRVGESISEEIADNLDWALNRTKQRSAVTAATYPRDGEKRTADGWTRNHLYSVVGFERVGQDGGLVTIRNPRGDNETSRFGTMTITLEEFSRNFDEYYLEHSPKHKSH